MRSIKLVCLALNVLIVLGAVAPKSLVALTPAQRQTIAQSVGTLVVPMAPKPRTGSCIVVSDQGHVVTSLQLVQGAAGANVVFRDGSKFEVAGYTAARKGKDLVILALRNARNLPPPLKLATGELAPGDAVEFIGSDAGKPYDFSQGTLVRVISGRQFLVGLEALSSARLDPDTCWLRTDTLQPPPSCGGAMLNSLGEVSGMMTYVPEWQNRIHTALHVAHIAEMLSGLEKVKAKSLAGLKKLSDVDPQELPDRIKTPLGAQIAPLRADVKEQFAAWQEKRPALDLELTALNDAKKTFQEKLDAQKAAMPAREAEAKKIEATLKEMKPEEEYTREEKDIEIDKEGQRRTVTRRVTDYRFTAGQKRQRAALEGQLTNIKTEVEKEGYNGLRWESWLQQAGMDQASNRRQASRLWTDLFYLTDPWNLRDADTHRALEQSLTEAIDAGGRAELFLARGVVRHNLEQFEQAREDFQRAARADKELAGVAQACEARLLLLDGKESEGRKLLPQAIRANAKDPHVALVQGLVELDAGRFAVVERNLLTALERGADPAEIHRMLALLLSTAPNGQPHSEKKALEHARRACALTAWQDSEALLALAAAQAEAGEFEQASEIAARAGDLAAGEVLQRAKAWQQSFENNERLRLAWGRPSPP